MEARLLIFVAACGIAALLASIAIWTPRRTPIRVAAVLAAAVFLPLGYLAQNELLSLPKPMTHEWFKRHVDEATVLGVSLDEGHAIYLWLRLDQSLEPRFYVLPWRRGLAEKLEKLIDLAIQDNATVILKEPFSKRGYTDIGDLNVELVRPPVPPQKPPPPPAQVFDPRPRDI